MTTNRKLAIATAALIGACSCHRRDDVQRPSETRFDVCRHCSASRSAIS